jgi:ribosome-binding protein aMBF1 (putative translation factor)
MEQDNTAVQTIKTPQGEELVVMPRRDYDALREALAEAEEELADIAVADERRREMASQAEPVLPAEVSASIMQGLGRVAAFRLWRGLSQEQLAKSSGIDGSRLADLEARRQELTEQDCKNLIAALQIPDYWLPV